MLTDKLHTHKHTTNTHRHTHTHTPHTHTYTHYTHTHTHILHTPHIHVHATYLHVTKPQDVQQVTNTQIYATVTKQNTINPVQNNKTQITFTYKQFIFTDSSVQFGIWMWLLYLNFALHFLSQSGGGKLLKMCNANIKCTIFCKQHSLAFCSMKEVYFVPCLIWRVEGSVWKNFPDY